MQYDVPKIPQRYAQDICPRYAPNTLKICSRYAQDMHKICPKYAWDMPKICSWYAQVMPEIYQWYTRDMPMIWQHLKNINQCVTEWPSNMDPRDASASQRITLPHWADSWTYWMNDQSGILTTIALHLSLMRPILGRWMSSQRYATWCHKMWIIFVCFFTKMRTRTDLWLPAPLAFILPDELNMILGVSGVPHGIPQPLPRSLFRVNKLQLDSGLGYCCERRVVPVCLPPLLPHDNVEFTVVLQRVMKH